MKTRFPLVTVANLEMEEDIAVKVAVTMTANVKDFLQEDIKISQKFHLCAFLVSKPVLYP